MRGKDNPCYGCTEATGRAYNCHTLCDGYKQFQDDCKEEKNVIKRKIYETECFEQEQEGKKMISTAKAIKKTREAQGMTQKELAERCCYTVTDIKAYELGEKEPKHINLMTIAGALGVTMYEMFERMEEIEEPENLNLDVIRNALEAYEANIVTPLDRVIVKALKELIEYKDIGLIPQAIKDMDKMYLEKCQQVNKLTCTCEMYERMAKK